MTEYDISLTVRTDRSPTDVVRLAAELSTLADLDGDTDVYGVNVHRWDEDDDGFRQLVPIATDGAETD